MRLFEEIKAAGYAGGYTQVKEYVRKVRPRAPEEPVVRFETPPGHQGQVDFADFRLLDRLFLRHLSSGDCGCSTTDLTDDAALFEEPQGGRITFFGLVSWLRRRVKEVRSEGSEPRAPEEPVVRFENAEFLKLSQP